MNSPPTTNYLGNFVNFTRFDKQLSVWAARHFIVCCHTLDKYVFPHLNVYNLTLFRETWAALMRHQLKEEESTILWTFVTRKCWATMFRKLQWRPVWASSRLRAEGRLPTTESSFWTIFRNAKFQDDTLNFDRKLESARHIDQTTSEIACLYFPFSIC